MRLILFFLLPLLLFGFNRFEQKSWAHGMAFLNFLEDNKIPAAFYYGLDEASRDSAQTIIAGATYSMLKNSKGKVIQALIPISEDLQISIIHKNGSYHFSTDKIDYIVIEEKLSFTVKNSIINDLTKLTGSPRLARELSSIFSDKINFRLNLRKGDKVAVVYDRKVRMGKTWGQPLIKYAFIETNKHKNYAFYNEIDESYYNDKAKTMKGMFLKYPLRFKRISSRFNLHRLNPVSKKYRPHNGIDYAANRGTPIKNVADGRIVWAGRKGGYGRTVIIRHKNGWRTLYAHLNGYSKNARKGKSVKQGDIIAYVGSSGLSTGAHLHFGVYRYNKPINPATIKGIRKQGLEGEEKKQFLSKIEPAISNLEYIAMLPEGIYPNQMAFRLE